MSNKWILKKKVPAKKIVVRYGQSKACTLCNAVYPNTRKYFGWKIKRKRILQRECLNCHEARRQNLYRNKQYRIFIKAQNVVYSRRRRVSQLKRLRGYIYFYLMAHPCVDCGTDDIRVLEFDHVRGKKKYNIAHLLCTTFSLATLKKEITKCDVRCANCHRIKTNERHKWWRANMNKKKKQSWDTIRRRLKKQFGEFGITTCELQNKLDHICTYNNYLSFAHGLKRRHLKGNELETLTILICINAHQIIEAWPEKEMELLVRKTIKERFD